MENTSDTPQTTQQPRPKRVIGRIDRGQGWKYEIAIGQSKRANMPMIYIRQLRDDERVAFFAIAAAAVDQVIALLERARDTTRSPATTR